MEDENDEKSKIFEIYLWVKSHTIFSKIISKIIIILIYLEFLLLNLMMNKIYKKSIEEENNTIIKIIEIYSIKYFLDSSYNFLYYIISFFIKIFIIINLLSFLILLTNKLEILHFKKIKILFSFSNFSLSTFLTIFFGNILLEEIFEKKYLIFNTNFSLVLNSIIFIFFLGLGIFHNLFKRMEYFNKEDFLNSTNKFFYLNFFIFKIIMIFGIKIIKFNFNNLYFILINLIFGLIYFYIYFSNFRKINFQNEEVDFLNVILISFTFGCWFSNFLIQIFPELNFWLIFMLFSLLLILLNMTSKKNIKKFLIKKDKKKIDLEEFVLLLSNLVLNLDKKREMVLKGIIINHKIFCKKIDCFCLKEKLYNANLYRYNKIKDNSSLVLFAYFMIKQLLLEKIEENNNKKYLFILIEFFIKKMNNYYLGLFYWNKLNLLKLNYFERFDLLNLKKDLDEIIKITGLEKCDDRNIEEIIFYDKTYNFLKQETIELISEIILFWKNFKNQKNKTINNENIQKMFGIIERKNRCKKIWDVLKIYFRHNPSLELFYKIFEKEILNKKIHLNIQDLYIQKKFSNIAKKEKLQNIFGQDFYKYFFEENSCVISLSLLKEELGLITQTNKNIKNLFLYTKEEIIGQSINILIPKSLKIFHTSILKKVKNKGKILYKNQNLQTIAVNKKNEPISLKLYYKSLLNKNFDISLIAYMHTLKKEDDYPFIITDKNGFIITFSSYLSEILNLKPIDCISDFIHIGFYNKKFLKFFEVFLDKDKKEFNKEKEVFVKNFEKGFLKDKEYKNFYKFFKGFEDKKIADLDRKGFSKLEEKNDDFKLFLKSKKIKEISPKLISIEFEHKKEKFKQNEKKEINFFLIKKVYETTKNFENVEEKKLISYKYKKKKSSSLQIKEYNINIAKTESKLNKTKIQEINYIKKNHNKFFKDQKNFPKTNLNIIRNICILFSLICLIMIILDIFFLNIFHLKKIKNLNLIFKSLFGYFTLIKKTSLTHNNFLSIYIEDYNFDFFKDLRENSISTKKFLEDDILRENLINFSKDKKIKVNLTDDNLYETNYFYLINNYLSYMFDLENSQTQIEDLKNKYWIFLETYKKNLFEIINPLKIYYYDKVEENFTSMIIIKYINYIIIAIFIFSMNLFFFIFLIRSYKNIFIFIEAFKYIEYDMIKEIINYYDKLKNFLVDKYSIEISENKNEIKINNITKENFEEEKKEKKEDLIKLKNFKDNNYIKGNIISIKKERKNMIIKFFCILISFLIIFFCKISLKEFLIDNIKNLQKIGIYIFEDYWKIPNIIMNSKDFYINSTSFKIMDESFKNNFNEENEIEIGNFYSKTFQIGKKINDLYKTPICDLKIKKDLFLKYEINNCEEFFSGILKSNLITAKKLLRSRLGFFVSDSDYKNFNYTSTDIPKYDKIQNIITEVLSEIVNKWWNEYFNISSSYKNYFKFITIFWIVFILFLFFLMYHFILKKLKKSYKVFKKIYLHFIPLETLEKNKLIGVKLKKVNILK